MIDAAVADLEKDPRDVLAWAQVAMILGDTGEPEAGLCVALYADSIAPRDPRIGSHMALFLLDLGLGDTTERGVRPRWEELAAWREARGDLEQAAWAALRQLTARG
jgi:hypothetical protein